MTVEFTHWSDWISKDHVDEVSWSPPNHCWRAFYCPNMPGRADYEFVEGATPREAVEKYIAWYATKCLTK